MFKKPCSYYPHGNIDCPNYCNKTGTGGYDEKTQTLWDGQSECHEKN